MKVENLTQTLKAQASIFLSVSVTGDLLKAVPETEEQRAEIIEKLPPVVKEQLAKVGAEIPTDLVDLSLDLGSFIFDVYYSNQQTPEAPLRKALFEREKQDLALKLSQKSFVLPEPVVSELTNVLSDDNLWKKVKISVYTGDPKGSNKNHYNFSHLIINNFGKVLEACLKLCLPPEDVEEEEPEVAPPPPKKKKGK